MASQDGSFLRQPLSPGWIAELAADEVGFEHAFRVLTDPTLTRDQVEMIVNVADKEILYYLLLNPAAEYLATEIVAQLTTWQLFQLVTDGCEPPANAVAAALERLKEWCAWVISRWPDRDPHTFSPDLRGVQCALAMLSTDAGLVSSMCSSSDQDLRSLAVKNPVASESDRVIAALLGITDDEVIF